MDNIINKIIEIDKKALTLKEKTKEMVENNETKIKKTLDDLEKTRIEEARKIGREKYESLMKEGEMEIQKKILETAAECERLEKVFLRVHEVLEEKVLEEIL